MRRYLASRLSDQERTLRMLSDDPELHDLAQLQAPYLDLEVRGVPVLRYFGGVVWGPVVGAMAEGVLVKVGCLHGVCVLSVLEKWGACMGCACCLH